MSDSTKKYRAFISYRHADNKQQGRQWATWLHQSLETYEIPEDLVGTKNVSGELIPERIYPIFRDEEELPADADLGSAIKRALDDSQLLIVLCSPNAVASPYVTEEIDYFKSQGHSNKIIAAMISGEPNCSWDQSKTSLGFNALDECFPLPLQFEYDDAGKRTTKHAEPIAADFRINMGDKSVEGWTSPEAYRQYLKETFPNAVKDNEEKIKQYQNQSHLMLLKIIAGVLGLPLGDLTKRDKEYQLHLEREKAKKLRRWLSAVALLAIVAIGAGTMAYFKQQEALKNEQLAKQQTEIAEQQTLVANEQTIKAEQQTEIAKQQQKIAIEQRDAALITQSQFLMDQADQANNDGNYDTALLLGLNAVPGLYGGDRPEIDFTSSLRNATINSAKHLILKRPKMSGIFQLSPDGKSFVIPEKKSDSSLWSVETGEKILTYHAKDRYGLSGSAFSKEGDLIVSFEGMHIYLYSIIDRKSKQKISIDIEGFNQIKSLAISPDATKIAAMIGNNTVYIVNIKDGKILHTLAPDNENGFENYVRFDKSGSRVLSALANNDVYVWSTDTGERELFVESAEYNNLSQKQSRLPLFSDENTLITFDTGGTNIWSITEQKLLGQVKDLHTIFHENGNIHAIIAARTTTFNYTAEQEQQAKNAALWFKDTNVSIPIPHQSAVDDAIISPDGKLLLTLDNLRSWTLWSTEKGNRIRTFKVGFVHKISFTQDSRYIVSSNLSDDQLIIWNVQTSWQNVSILKKSGFGKNHLISPKSSSIAVQTMTIVDNDQKNNKYQLSFYSTDTGQLLKSHEQSCSPNMSLSPSKQYLMMKCNSDKKWSFYLMKTGEKIDKDIPSNSQPIFSANEQYIADVGYDNVYAIYDFQQDKKLHEFEDSYEHHRIDFSPNEESYITVDDEGNIKRWSLSDDSVELLYKVKGKLEKLFHSLDGKFIVAYVKNKQLLLLSAKNGLLLQSFSSDKIFTQIWFSPNSDYLLTLNNEKNGLLEIWSIRDLHVNKTNTSLSRSSEDIRVKKIFPYSSYSTTQFHGEGELFSNEGDSGNIFSMLTGKKHLGFHYSQHNVSSINFSEDGETLLVVTHDGMLKKIPLYKDNLTEQAIIKLPINRKCLTDKERVKYYLPALKQAQKRARQCDDL